MVARPLDRPITRRAHPVAYPFFLKKLLIRTGLARLVPGMRRGHGSAVGFLHYYSDRLLAAPDAELAEAAALFDPRQPDVIDLAQGAACLDSPPLPRSPERRGSPGLWGLPELRQAVADKLAAEHALAVNPAHEVLITHGAAGAFSTVLDAFVNPGDRVVVFDPTSPLYLLALKQRRARVRAVPAAVEGGQLRFRIDRLAGALHRARLLVLSDPANPTGGVLAPEDLEQILWWADHHDVLVLQDEAFARFRYEGERTPLGSLPRAGRRTLVAGSVSKGHGLASARVGWLGGHRHLVGACMRSAGLAGSGVATLCQQLALAALRQPEREFEPVLHEFAARRRYAHDRLNAAGLRSAWPAGGFFCWVPVGQLGLTGRAFADRLLDTKRVLVVPGELFGPGGLGFVRLSYATDDGRLREGLTRLVEFVRAQQGAPAVEPAVV
jgi:aspartate/methionine/tyrosine aminotransferase